MQEKQDLKKGNRYLILLIYPNLYILFIISQMCYYPTSFKYWSLINLLILIEVVIIMILIYRKNIKTAILLGMYPLSYILFRFLIELVNIGGHIHMTFGGNPPIQILISIYFLQPTYVIGLVVINLIMIKFKERESYKDKVLHSEKVIYHFKSWGIHFFIGLILSYIMTYFLHIW